MSSAYNSIGAISKQKVRTFYEEFLRATNEGLVLNGCPMALPACVV
jgi:hypothetical protein